MTRACPICGHTTDAPGRKTRSIEQHRRYFALIAATWHHWPESHERQFTTAEELRAWLQMKAGYREVAASIPIAGMNRDKALLLVEAAIRGAGSYAVPVLHGASLVVFRPKSIAFGKLPHLAFCALNDAVAEVIQAEAGLSAETLLHERTNEA